MEISNAVELENRINKVFDLLVMGANRATIIEYGKKEWGLQTRWIDEYIRRAREQIKEAAAIEREQMLGEAKERLHLVIRMAFKSQDLARVIAAQAQLNTLYGLNAPEKKIVSFDGDNENEAFDRLYNLLNGAAHDAPTTQSLAAPMGDADNDPAERHPESVDPAAGTADSL